MHPEHNRLPCLWNIAFIALCFLLLTGCAVKRNNYNVPALDLPKQYTKAPAVFGIADSGNVATHSPELPSGSILSSPLNSVLAEWWRLLDSQELNGLVDRALANNPDLRIAVLRIAQSKVRLEQAGADKAPVITMPIQIRNEYPDSGIGRGNPNGNNKSRLTNQISLKGDWRPDIWGETASLYEAAELQLLRATYQRDDTQRNVVANVVVAYMEYLSLNDRLRVARETEKSLSEMLSSVDERLKVGDATITEMEQQKAAVYSVKATIPVLDQQREVVLNRLASLVGSAPVALKLSNSGLDSAIFPSVLPGMPSALLLRRPDVRAVEARLLAADADIDVARARVLPPLDLSAQVGYGSMYISQLFTPQALFWNTIANLSVTVFDSGKRSKEVEFAQAMHEELLETYVRVIYDAVREVDDSLSAVSFMGTRLDVQGVATDSSLRAWNFSQEAFMTGAVDYLVVLDTQRTYQRNLDDWYNVRMDRYRGLVNLFSALGGGVPGGDAMPGEGARPAPLTGLDADTALSGKRGATENNNAISGRFQSELQEAAAQPDRVQAEGVDWLGESLRGNANGWLVELSGVYDRGAVLPAWRDLRARFPGQVENRILLPHRQGQVNAAGKERASWYRLFIAAFPDKNMAEKFCATLGAGQQRCGVVSQQSLAGKGDFVAPSILGYEGRTMAEVAVNTAGISPPGKNDKDEYPLSSRPDMAQAKDEQRTQAQAEELAAASLGSGGAQDTKAEAERISTAQAPQTEGAGQPAEAALAGAQTALPQMLVERYVKDWATAWSNKDTPGYLAAYVPDFKPKGMSHAAWKRHCIARFNKSKIIGVTLGDIYFSVQDDSHATASFTQNYHSGSYYDLTEKTLEMVKQSDRWLIVGERAEKVIKVNMKAKRTHAKIEAEAAKQDEAESKAKIEGETQMDKQAKIEAEAR